MPKQPERHQHREGGELEVGFGALEGSASLILDEERQLNALGENDNAPERFVDIAKKWGTKM
jgi:hypothetical protein